MRLGRVKRDEAQAARVFAWRDGAAPQRLFGMTGSASWEDTTPKLKYARRVFQFVGREKMALAAAFLATVTETITRLDVIRAGEIVVVKGGAEFRDQDDHTSGVASCDIFRFAGGMLVELTSCVVEVKSPD
jgi:hypothetical protein